MKRSKVYKQLARRMERGEKHFLCATLANNHPDAFDHFVSFMRPTRLPREHWLSGWWGHASVQKNNDARIIALCFMAAIAEDEE